MDLSNFESLFKNLTDEANNETSTSYIFSKEIDLDLKLIDLLEISITDKIFYFKSKYNSLEILALGSSISFKSAHEIKQFIDAYPSAFVCAPLKFENNEQFLSEVFVAECTFVKKNETTNIILSKQNDKPFPNFNLFFDKLIKKHLHYDTIRWKETTEEPDQDLWCKKIDIAKNLFKESKISKIVLSRSKSFVLSYPIEPRIVFIQLLRNNDHSDSVYNVYFQENLSTAFMSISPEILFSKIENEFFTISLASSTPRGESAFQDKNLENKLQNNSKLKTEHEIVTDEILKRIEPLITSKVIKDTKAMKLSYIQHNCREIFAQLKDDADVFEILEVLHPTPAVGGLPKDNAIKFISELENKSRNYYAAPIGYFNRHQTEFSVAIRSGEIKNQTLTIFGGAGILPESSAEDEWVETGIKMSPFLKVFKHV